MVKVINIFHPEILMIKESWNIRLQQMNTTSFTQPKKVASDVKNKKTNKQTNKKNPDIKTTLSKEIDDQRILKFYWIRSLTSHTKPKVAVSYATFS